MRLIYYWCLLICLPTLAQATTVSETIYINRDSMETVLGEKFPYTAFNLSPSFEQRNALIELSVGDSLDLWVVNNDSISHQFAIKGTAIVPQNISAGDSVRVQALFATMGLFIYYDNLNYPENVYMGLAGGIYVKESNHAHFYWNIKEHQASWNTALANQGVVNWATYTPDYFTINGNSNPAINLDPTARITGQVGDTLLLSMVNTGQSIHSMHFHGYHVQIRYSSKFPHHVGRSKDTVPIYPMETLLLEIVPDKEGEYPVHDHNLVAVTANDIYPNGMFSTILITP
ncbi:multicopper oxidase domain-containing protein [Aureispira anguillae]|uniref:Multicopper oxidase domain-containing protein n=1 Tax=Aureispira anguillae TaxID=2864201 RepID=A0A915VK11_9BACT|nr:multicopper oxidase domain-containing protein [Aureispira anguillae]BDS09438.1 multicopper oxidase domain-containing protein [Aureispira anguillae]